MLCTGRHTPESAPSKDDALRKPLVIKLRLFLLFFLLVLTVTGCRSSEVFSYGEIVYRIDYSRPDETRITEENLARTLQVAKPLAPMFYEPVFLDWGIPIERGEPYEDYVKRVAREEAADPSWNSFSGENEQTGKSGWKKNLKRKAKLLPGTGLTQIIRIAVPSACRPQRLS